MTFARPTIFPDMAVNTDGTDNDVLDPATNQNNAIAPPAPRQLTGWLSNEKPFRQYFNWLHRITTQWLRWFFINTWHSENVTIVECYVDGSHYPVLPDGWNGQNSTVVCGIYFRDDDVELAGYSIPYDTLGGKTITLPNILHKIESPTDLIYRVAYSHSGSYDIHDKIKFIVRKFA